VDIHIMKPLRRASRAVAALRATGAEVLSDAGSRAIYASDASIYRVVPTAIVRPRDEDEVRRVIETAIEWDLPITPRGAGTSVAGNAIGSGVVLDFARYMDSVISIDRDRRVARVQPGVIQASLQAAARPLGLRFGPDPSTHNRCTIGGMIANNACGSHSLAYGRTSDTVVGLRGVLADGKGFEVGHDLVGKPTRTGLDDAATRLDRIVAADLAVVRTEFGRFGRQSSGYAVEHLLPERGMDIARALAGTEGTLAVFTEAEVSLVPEVGYRNLVAIGFASFADAGFAASATLAFAPTAVEGLDARITEVVKHRRGPDSVPPLPKGMAWLLVELSGDDPVEAEERARALASLGLGVESRLVSDPAEAARIWRIREDGAGLAGRAPSGKPAWAGWEDAAVPVELLGPYLLGFEELLHAHGLTAMPFGHFGEGCIHVRLDYELDRGNRRDYREFVEAAADLVSEFGGSLSGEHGDGRARSELLDRMYSPSAIAIFAGVKRAFDPQGRLNPGVIVAPALLDADIRVGVPGSRTLLPLSFGYAHDGGDFSRSVHRCTGVGACRANPGTHGVMCPSYRATHEDRHSTRGRARLLQEAIQPDGIVDWKSPDLADALDLCLSCKGCLSDCPTGVDMATYKSEVLQHRFRRRIRPRSHYTLGWLPRWSKVASAFPRLANWALSARGIRRIALFAAGVDSRRSIPKFATETFRAWFERRPVGPTGEPVALFVDSFTNHFQPDVPKAMVMVLESAGFAPVLTSSDTCCGLTWITTGQLDAAKRILTRSVASLDEFARSGVPIVGVEPSCTAVLRSDAPELLGSAAAARVKDKVLTLTELLIATGAAVPDLGGIDITAQPHCHHHAVMGWEADQAYLESAGASVTRVGGCCGLAGNFGIERGHHDLSVAVAELDLLPAIAEMAPDSLLVADGFSCRTQISHLADRPSIHLAQLIAAAQAGDTSGPTRDLVQP
jgi:FAD/FMN-containing dehydrogenase/Fe-S oxidoreductase